MQNELSELSKDIPKLLENNGIRGKKFTKAVDNFSYNLALLHGQTDLLNKARQDANVTIRQVICKCTRQSFVDCLCVVFFRFSKVQKPLIYLCKRTPVFENSSFSPSETNASFSFLSNHVCVCACFLTCAYMCMHILL